MPRFKLSPETPSEPHQQCTPISSPSQRFLGGTRWMVLYFHEPMGLRNVGVLKLVLGKLERYDNKCFTEDPGDDSFIYKFEVDIPASVESQKGCHKTAVNSISDQLVDVVYLYDTSEAEKAVQYFQEKVNLARFKEELHQMRDVRNVASSWVPLSVVESSAGKRTDGSGDSEGEIDGPSFGSQSEDGKNSYPEWI
ncbi:uncharacterized protein LDX57_008607 [Aspergillus melleus]|uniref:uncharacterized protein n=1 Tax=Aspergillus melleus TaxID=138277 RepID=UPI001E8EC97E|nr:uncharacterized protein LDX57_008607 [Aspergillus melleus]KAH8430944.1 hypothetical protein LDX57_008607 [Aspergillus melleus]